MKILAIGDIVGLKSVDYLADRLFRVKGELGADMVIANGENATEIHGVSKKEALAIFDAGVDVITLGNHTYRKADICELLGSEANIIRPANYPPMAPGAGHIIVNVKGKRVLCINVLGVAFMEALACPFETVDQILRDERGNYDIGANQNSQSSQTHTDRTGNGCCGSQCGTGAQNEPEHGVLVENTVGQNFHFAITHLDSPAFQGIRA